ncbi:hypothetical protein [Paenibacillus sp. EPM92]|uniref:hypothetical protein n=1 Tax=Paenibacillus sp. EPM92 TaxID=1561195 RepID=UPI001914DECD|nr:hypothetical protein [Paenibacillus sp. EPM92]
MLPINETLIHFFNSYGGASRNTTIETYELQDMGRSTRIYNSLTRPMDINSLVANIEGICSEINGEANAYPIVLVDKKSDRSVMLQTSDAIQYYAYRIEVTVHES